MKLRALFLRARRNEVVFFCYDLPADPTVSQKKPAIISFSNRNKKFYSLPCLLLLLFMPGAMLLAQKITISQTNVPMQKIFSEIEKQSNYQFFYSDNLLQKAGNVSIDVKNVSVKDALNNCFRNQPLTYAVVDNTIIVKPKEETNNNDTLSARRSLITVKGKVIGTNGEPVAGASVNVKGTNTGTATDANGDFTLDADDNAVLVVSSVSHTAQEIKVHGKTSLFISLKELVNQLDEAIVVAYNTTTQRTNTGAVTVVKGEQVQNLPNRSFDKSLQGLVPGLLVTGGTGQPGGGISNFVLRGIATAASATNGSTVRNPLIIIDGVPVSQDNFQLFIDNPNSITNPLAQLNPADIETIAVLKDASAIALYGSRASNGVIVITTKKGKAGKTMVSFRHQTDIASRLKGNVDVLNQQEYLDLLYETYRNTNPVLWTDAKIKTDLISKFPTIVRSPGDTSFYTPDDWNAAVYSDHALTVSNQLSISGGNEKTNFYLNLEYSKQNGVVKETGYDRKSLRFNFENRPTSWLKFGLNTAFSYNVQDYSNALRGREAPIGSSMSPLNPVRLADGSYMMNYSWGLPGTTGVTMANPVAAAQYNINRNTAYRGLSKIYGELSFLKNFKLISSAGIDFMLAEAKEKADPRLFDQGNPATPNTASAGRIEEQDVRRANLITTNILRFDKRFGHDHALGIIAGQEAQILNQKNLLVAVRGLKLPYYDQINSPGVTVLRQFGFITRESLLSFFGQANYGFKNRYFLSSSIRTDGSSRFGEDKRYGTYWSTGAGWVISSESFMRAARWLNYLKIRGSIGAAGNAGAINANTRFDQLQNATINPAIFTGTVAVYATNTPGNPNVKWERTSTQDAGLEARFFKERIAITADVYKRTTSDLIYSINLPGSSGYQTVLSNIGKMENKGIELSISADIIRSAGFNWNINANWATNKNVLVKANVPTAAAVTAEISNQQGQNFNSYYMYVWAGVNPADGNPMFIDSSGKPTVSFSKAMKQIVGKPQPDGFGAVTNTFSFKGVEVSAMFYYQYGFEIYDRDFLVNDGYYPYLNQDRRALDRWRNPGDIAANPKRILNNTNNSAATTTSTRFLYKGDYIRLQNVMIGYRLPARIISRVHLSALKVFVQGNNLAIWTKYPGQDPGGINVNGTAESIYPGQRSFSIGLNASF